jgi:hydrogenase maturation protease
VKKILVIGYGNTLRGDDAAGIRAAEEISRRHPEIPCLCMHQLMPEMSEQISEYDTVFFVDADVNASVATARTVEILPDTDQPRTHFISPESLLSLSLRLYQRHPEKAYIIGIPVLKFDFSEELTITALNGIEQCIKIIEKIAGL